MAATIIDGKATAAAIKEALKERVAALTQQDTDTSFAVRQGQRLEVNDFGGQVVIKAWRQNSIRIRASHGSRDYIRVSNVGSTISIGASSRHGPPMVDYELLVPAWLPLAVSGSPSAEVNIEGTDAEVSVETVEGSIRVVGGKGNISLHTVDVPVNRATLVAIHLGRMKDAGTLRPEHVSLGKLGNVDAALEVARSARQVLGANGVTLEYPVIRHMNNLESVVTYEGTADVHALVIGAAVTGIQAFR